jgi:hypothetical protein
MHFPLLLDHTCCAILWTASDIRVTLPTTLLHGNHDINLRTMPTNVLPLMQVRMFVERAQHQATMDKITRELADMRVSATLACILQAEFSTWVEEELLFTCVGMYDLDGESRLLNLQTWPSGCVPGGICCLGLSLGVSHAVG